MIEAHTLDAWTRVADRHARRIRRRARILGGFAAPLFLWLAGLGVVLSAPRVATPADSRPRVPSMRDLSGAASKSSSSRSCSGFRRSSSVPGAIPSRCFASTSSTSWGRRSRCAGARCGALAAAAPARWSLVYGVAAAAMAHGHAGRARRLAAVDAAAGLAAVVCPAGRRPTRPSRCSRGPASSSPVRACGVLRRRAARAAGRAACCSAAFARCRRPCSSTLGFYTSRAAQPSTATRRSGPARRPSSRSGSAS